MLISDDRWVHVFVRVHAEERGNLRSVVVAEVRAPDGRRLSWARTVRTSDFEETSSGEWSDLVTGLVAERSIGSGLVHLVLPLTEDWARRRASGESNVRLEITAWNGSGAKAVAIRELDLRRQSRHSLARGDAMARGERFDRAIRHYGQAVVLAPSDPEPRFRGGVARLRSGDGEGGAADLSEALRLKAEAAIR